MRKQERKLRVTESVNVFDVSRCIKYNRYNSANVNETESGSGASGRGGGITNDKNYINKICSSSTTNFANIDCDNNDKKSSIHNNLVDN